MADPRNEKKDPVTIAEEVIPLVEERVRIGKRMREGRTVSISTRPVSETVSLSEPLTREHVSVERVPVGEVIDAVPPVREEGDLTIIPVVEERIRVIVDLVLVEEIHLRRTREEVVEEIDIERRRTEVDINE